LPVEPRPRRRRLLADWCFVIEICRGQHLDITIKDVDTAELTSRVSSVGSRSCATRWIGAGKRGWCEPAAGVRKPFGPCSFRANVRRDLQQQDRPGHPPVTVEAAWKATGSV
jgi:hypothetical protein